MQGLWEYDSRVGTVYHAPSWKILRGYGRDEYVDPSREAWLERTHPDDHPHIAADAERQRVGDFDTIEYRERHRDGHYIWILSRGKPVEWDKDGTPIRTIGTDTDITRLKLTEDALAAEKERLRVTLESIGDGVISTDSVGNVTFLNATAKMMTGWDGTDGIGKPIDQIFAVFEEETGHAAASPVVQCLRDGEVVSLDTAVVLIDQDGDKREIRSTAAPVRTPDGSIIGAVLVFQDVTSSRTLQKQLAHSATHDVLAELHN